MRTEPAPPHHVPTTGGPPSEHEATIREVVAALDVEALSRRFHEQGQFLYLDRFLPPAVVDGLLPSVRRLLPGAHRVWVPRMRKAGTVPHVTVAREAPFLYALYRSPSFLEFTRRLTGAPLGLKNERDAHAATLYVYQRPGDHVGFHYDACGCEDGLSYTATLGLVNRTTSHLHVQLFCKEPDRRTRDLYLPMHPGSLVFFCGSRVHHRVTPILRGEERVTYSFAYVREGRRLDGMDRFVENLKDALLYFGPRAIVQRNYG